MRLVPIATGAVLVFTGCAAMAAMSGASAAQGGLRAQPPVSELSALRRRPRPALRVTPHQPAAWTSPRPGYYSYPGPNAVRQCADWYVTENRPSGAVITPQMRCRWVPG